jgi:hypothetical protein
MLSLKLARKLFSREFVDESSCMDCEGCIEKVLKEL